MSWSDEYFVTNWTSDISFPDESWSDAALNNGKVILTGKEVKVSGRDSYLDIIPSIILGDWGKHENPHSV
jgi:hypothetical protein